MPISLADLTRKTRTVVVDFDGDTINVTYAPGRLTPGVESRLTQANEDGRPASGVADELARLLLSWDIMGDDGAPAPITSDLLHELPTALLLRIVAAIGEDSRPNAQSAVT